MLETIKHQSTGDSVKVAQYLTGYAERNKASGTFDAGFVSFVCSWQSSHGLTSNGEIDSINWNAIASIAPTCSTSKNKKSAATCAVQILVGGLTVDGDYGTKTKRAVAAYQAAKGLVADGVCGPKTYASLISAEETATVLIPGSDVVIKQPVDYKQYDSRWGGVKYSTHTSSQTISNSGCGPTAMADIVATWWDKTVTPKEMCKLSVDNGYRTYDSGTAWGFFEFCAKKYKAFQFIQTKSISVLKAALAQGAYVIVSFGSSKWTKNGHFCCIWKWDGKYFYINDPASASSSRAKGTESEVKDAAKQYFIFYKEDPAKQAEAETRETTVDTGVTEQTKADTPAATVATGSTGDKIIDISKYQGAIDWDKLAPNLALVIIKASGLYKNGADSYYAKNVEGAVKHGVPFHAYHFLYCTSESEAKRDAALFYNTVKSAGHWPLFWVLDCEKEWGVKDKEAKKVAEAFEDELRRLAGDDIKVAVYIGHNVYESYALDYNHYGYIWIPRYGSNNGTLEGSTKPAYACDLWQYTSTGKMPGISGNVDINIITGQGRDLKWFLGETGESVSDVGVNVQENRQYVQIVNGNVNVRTQPDTSGNIVGVAYKGDRLEYAGETASNGWLAVMYNGEKRWLSGKYGELVM